MSGQRGTGQGRGAQGLLLWAPVALACGTGAWFSWPGTPGGAGLALAAGLMAGALLLLWRAADGRLYLPVLAVSVALAGFLFTDLRSRLVAAPVLQGSYYGPVEGRIVKIDRGRSDRLRLTLDQVRLDRRGPWPEQLRLTLQSAPAFVPQPGMQVMTTAWLSAPEASAEPGGFNFARHAWFQGLGAVGAARAPVLQSGPAEGAGVRVAALRMWLSAEVRARIPGEAGAFAAAMLTGDRSAMGQQAVQDLRDSNLYHLVSISGVHMSLLAGFIYQGLRGLLALIPWLALRVPAHKIAAAAALPVCTFYLILSGGDVATLRAWVMVAVMLGAVLADRRALSLRSVALAAVVILILTPEALTEPGFQMSFAATTALVAGLDALRAVRPAWLPVWAWVLVLSSLLAGLASAPFAAAHFYRISPWGLVPNLIASPVMGILVMPGGVLLAVLAPLGLEEPARLMLDWGTRAVLEVAARTAAWEGMVRPLVRPREGVLALVSIGALAGILLPGRLRLVGGLLLLLTPLAWLFPGRPDLLISADGRLSGLATLQGRALSHPRGAGFAAEAWLAADGDGISQAQAARRAGYRGPPGDRRFQLGALRGRHLLQLPPGDLCDGADLVILAVVAPEADYSCLLIDARRLAQSGAVAVSLRGQGPPQIRGARENPPRVWTPLPQRLP